MITKALLRTLRNDLPMSYTINQLGNRAPFSKISDGHFRFICPNCSILQATVNPSNNLAHCFSCQKNFNNIDLMLEIGYGFIQAVKVLNQWLLLYKRHQRRLNKAKTIDPPTKTIHKREKLDGAIRFAEIIQKQFGQNVAPKTTPLLRTPTHAQPN